MKERVAIVIPFHKTELTDLEQISLQQCINVFYGYSIFLVIPDKCYAEWAQKPFNLIYIRNDNKWFENITAYNKMMMSDFFYERFKDFEYILIYQLDAFVFSNRLEEFCSYNYDYIGAPWLSGLLYSKCFDNKGLLKVGNSGFSLKKTKSFLEVLKTARINGTLEDFVYAEDVFWATQDSASFRVAPIKVALNFSFETEVRKCYSLNEKKLPFGCHAWEKYDFAFWKPFIEKAGYSFCRKIEGNLDKQNERFYKSFYSCFIQWNHDSKDLFIFGTGKLGEWFGWVLLFRAGIESLPKNTTYIDNDNKKWGERLWGIEIQSPDILNKHKDGKLLIVIAVNPPYRQEILLQLEKMGYKYKKDVIYYSDLVPTI